MLERRRVQTSTGGLFSAFTLSERGKKPPVFTARREADRGFTSCFGLPT
jgi:hypothetical protein